MSDTAQSILDQAIELSAARRDPWRVAGDDSTAGKLTALLFEVGAAILPRRIEVRIGTAQCTITANSGRIVSTDLGQDQVVAEGSREDRLARVADAMFQFTRAEGQMELWACPVSDIPAEDEIGLTKGALREYCDQAGYLSGKTGPDADDGLSFFDALGEAADMRAMLSSDGLTVTAGDPSLLMAEAELRAVADGLPDDLFADLGQGDVWIVGQSSAAPDRMTGLVKDADSITFYAGRARHMSMLAHKWAAARNDGNAGEDQG